MFSPERLLGGLIRNGVRRKRGLGGLISGGAALGLVGIAIEAAEHFMNQRKDSARSGPPPTPPPAGLGAGHASPPPVPGGLSLPPPPPAGPQAQGAEANSPRQEDSILLIQAMIAAANADGIMDAQERAAILNSLESAELGGEEHQFIARELLDPKPMQYIVAAASSPELARRVYLASLPAIEADTDKEIEYLRDLAQQLGLSRHIIEAIHEQAGAPLTRKN